MPEPGKPQSLNRFAYGLNNPLRYVDPTGHLSDDEIMRWTSLETKNLLEEFIKQHYDLYTMLQRLHFGDLLYWAGSIGGQSVTEEFLGRASLVHDRLRFTGSQLANPELGLQIEDLVGLTGSPSSRLNVGRDAVHGGFELRRLLPGYGNHIPLVFQSGTFAGGAGKWRIGDLHHPEEWVPGLAGGSRAVTDYNWEKGIGIALVSTGVAALTCSTVLLCSAGIALVVDRALANVPGRPGTNPGDVTYTWTYENGATETTIIRGEQIFGPEWSR